MAAHDDFVLREYFRAETHEPAFPRSGAIGTSKEFRMSSMHDAVVIDKSVVIIGLFARDLFERISRNVSSRLERDRTERAEAIGPDLL